MNNKQSKLTLLTHLSYDYNDMPYIGSAMPLTDMSMPTGRLTGMFGRTTNLKANPFWWERVSTLYGKPLSKVELYLQDKGDNRIDQSVKDIDGAEVLNILLAQPSLIDQLDRWSSEASFTNSLHLIYRKFIRLIKKILDTVLTQTAQATVIIDPSNKRIGNIYPIKIRYFDNRDLHRNLFKRIAENPEIINKLFDRPELSHIKAIIWPAIDPDNENHYIKLITLRNVNDVSDRRIYNFNGDPESVPYDSTIDK